MTERHPGAEHPDTILRLESELTSDPAEPTLKINSDGMAASSQEVRGFGDATRLPAPQPWEAPVSGPSTNLSCPVPDSPQQTIRRRRTLAGGWPRFATVVLVATAGSAAGRPVEAGVNVWTSGGPEGGTVTRLAVNPRYPESLLALTSGGLFVSSDGAASWRWAGLPGDAGAVLDLVYDPGDPAAVYVATTIARIQKSVDGGAHWTACNVGLGDFGVARLAVGPGPGETFYAASGDAIFRSDDRAATWREVYSRQPDDPYFYAIAVDPASALTVYAGADSKGVYKSTDGGATWAAATAGLPTGGFVTVSALAMDAGRPAGLYALVSQGQDSPTKLYRSTDGAVTWSLVFGGSTAGVDAFALGPHDPATIVIGSGQRLLCSTDGGGSWTTLGAWSDPRDLLHAVILDPQNRAVLYAGIEGKGVVKTSDGGATWLSAARGITNTQVHSVAIDPTPPNPIYAVDFFDRRVFRSTDEGEGWSPLPANPACVPYSLAIDPHRPSTMYVTCWDAVAKTTDGGASWQSLKDGFRGALWPSALAIDPADPLTLYAGGSHICVIGCSGDPLYKTTDGGAHWAALTLGPTTQPDVSNAVSALAIDPRGTGTVFAGASLLYRSSDAGRTWVPVLLARVIAIAVHPSAPDVVYATDGSDLYKSTDAGFNWTHSTPGLWPIDALALDPLSPATVYLGSNGKGVARSTDGGATWTRINGGLGNEFVWALAVDQTGTRLHAGTDWGGVFDLEISTATPTVSLSPATTTVLVGATTLLTVTVEPPQLMDVSLAVSSSPSTVVSVPVVVTLPATQSSVSFQVEGLASGSRATIALHLPEVLGGGIATAAVTVKPAGSLRPPRLHLRGIRP